MNIKILIDEFKKIQLNLKKIEEFVDGLAKSDVDALISAMYIGRDHLHNDKLNSDHVKLVQDGEFNRKYHADLVATDEVARKLYEKQMNLFTYFDKFISCSIQSDVDLDFF